MSSASPMRMAVSPAELGDAIQAETVDFPQDGVLRRPGVMQLLDEAAKAGADNIGGLDPGTIDGNVEAVLDGLFDIAVKRNVGLDSICTSSARSVSTSFGR